MFSLLISINKQPYSTSKPFDFNTKIKLPGKGTNKKARKQYMYGHCNYYTESAQWADSVKILNHSKWYKNLLYIGWQRCILTINCVGIQIF